MVVPLGRELVSSYRLRLSNCVNTNHPCIWYRLVVIFDASFDWGLPTPSLGGKCGRMGSEMGRLRSPGTTSYRLPIVKVL